MKMEILLIPCIIFRLKLLGSSGPGLRNVMYPIIFFQTSMLDQLSSRRYVFFDEESCYSPPRTYIFHSASTLWCVSEWNQCESQPNRDCMNAQVLRLLFQERSAIEKLLATPSFCIQDSKILAWLQGDGPRLDALIKAGILQRNQELIGPGPMLLLLDQGAEARNPESCHVHWRQTLTDLRAAVHQMEAAESNPDARLQAGKTAMRLLNRCRWWTLALTASVQQPSSPSWLEQRADEMKQAAREVQRWLLMHPAFPEWEEQQHLLTFDLDQAAALCRWQARTTADRRLEKIRRISQQRSSAEAKNIRLKESREGIPFLMLHQELGITTHPAPESGNHPSGPLYSLEEAPESIDMPDLTALAEAWQASGQHLFHFLQNSPLTRHLPESPRLSLMSSLMQQHMQQITWKKAPTGDAWEAFLHI